MTYWDFSGYTPTDDVKGICSFSSCGDPTRTISHGDPAYHSKDLDIIFHEKCFKQTKMYQDGDWLRDDGKESTFDENELNSLLIDIPDDSSDQRAPQQKSFWARHRTKIILGLSVSVAIAAVAIRLAKPEELHTICLQSAENAKELFCCVKEVSRDIATCAFKIFEPVNIWSDAGNPREFHIAELPPTNPEPVILSRWAVKGTQKLFQRIFGQ